MASHWPEITFDPGCRTLVPYFSDAAANSFSGFMSKWVKTRKASRMPPPISNAALTTCTQVVANIPPNST